ncbi:MAG: ABC transporter substrate-binding protein, partial [Burkholderiales bacterium]
SSGLSSYRDQTIEFKPLRAQPADTEVTVKSEVKRSSGEPVTIDYSMEKSTGSWKVYDVVIAGVSLVTTYRDSFRDEVRQSGIDGLVKSLSEKNRKLAGAKA